MAPRTKHRRLTATLLASTAALTVILSAPLPAFAGDAAQHEGAIQPTELPHALPDFVALVKQVKPAVVSITSKMRVPADEQPQMQGGFPGFPGFPFPGVPFGQAQPSRPRTTEARGSGFIIDADGTVVTNNHVVKGATSVTVTLADGTELPAKILGRDARTDLAVLKITSKKRLPFILLGDSSAAEPGAWVVAVGNPFGLGGSVTLGIVSALGRDIGEGPYDSFMQVDAAINPGNSGGPLFNQDGKVVGVNTAITSPSGGSVGIGFAIPSNTVKAIVAQLKKSGHVTRGYIGVETQPVTSAMAGALKLPEADNEDRGALVAGVEPDSPAARAGLQPRDVILGVNGTKVGSPKELAIAIAGVVPGSHASLKIIRNGAAESLDVTVTTLAADQGAAGVGDNGEGGSGGLGVNLSPITPQLRQQLNLADSARGAIITEIKPGSPAESAGLQAGDLITGVGDKAVSTPAEAARAIRAAIAANPAQAVVLRILRNGQPLFIGAQIGGGDQPDGDSGDGAP